MECVKNADVAKEIKRIMLNMKETVTAFLKQGIGSLEDEIKLEEFFQLVAQLEQKSRRRSAVLCAADRRISGSRIYAESERRIL